MTRATRRHLLRAALALPLLAALPAAQAAGREVHGESDAFDAAGVTVAWAILRAASVEDATVVLRVVRDPARLPALAVVGVDPFGGATQAAREAGPAPATLDVTMPRRRFADFPRTEIRLFATARPSPGEAPALTVFYQGLPDTTPELATEAALRAWLDDRVARLRAAGGRKP